ncbi:competence/damage-inducible protein A [Hyphomicrobiales bacterium]|jgi:molybdenum cofactor synthesis domain-containing protein|nr:competence/damage-inducible protein A [Hyphomicrobiales bacterium]|tara:strand:+ start:7530 stop:8282 length:753 start_codon:yes stop_codon:yes gene_type:complete
MVKKAKYSASVLVIGDEILSGRTQDTNSNYIAKKMAEIGIDTSEIRVIPDIKEVIIESVNELREKNDYLFTTGGIGPTHDDITAESIALAFGVKIELNESAFSVLKKYYEEIGSPFNEVRQRMARIPVGATLIENPVSKAPGFKIENVFVFAGIPKIMIAMLENSLKFLHKGSIVHSQSVKVDAVEGDIADTLSLMDSEDSDLRIGSYPFFNSKVDFGVNVVIKSVDKDKLSKSVNKFKEFLNKNSLNFD